MNKGIRNLWQYSEVEFSSDQDQGRKLWKIGWIPGYFDFRGNYRKTIRFEPVAGRVTIHPIGVAFSAGTPLNPWNGIS